MTAGLARLSATSVEFTGARGGESPLSWGQLAIWRLTRWLDDDDPYFNMPWVLPVYGRRDLDTVLRALRALVERHETLRTTYEGTPGGLVQRVARRGRFGVEVSTRGRPGRSPPPGSSPPGWPPPRSTTRPNCRSAAPS